jgi:mannose-6-phosphate isomerase-like protein (cupin superfamily)
MRVFAALVFATLVSVPLAAQQGAQAPSSATMKVIASSADVQGVVAKLKAAHTNQPLQSARLFQLAPYNVNIEYRTAGANAAIHETEAEFFYVIDGAGTFVTGGHLVDPQRTNPQNLSAKQIADGTTAHVSKGDFMLVPEGVPHQVTAVDSPLVFMTVHLPRK